MSCNATTQGDEMYCSRCHLRWKRDDQSPPLCLPAERRQKRRVRVVTPTPATGFDPRAFTLQHRGFISSLMVLDRMEQVVRLAYAEGFKAGAAK